MGDPIAAQVQNFVEITNLPRERAKLWLQVSIQGISSCLFSIAHNVL